MPYRSYRLHATVYATQNLAEPDRTDQTVNKTQTRGLVGRFEIQSPLCSLWNAA